MARNSSNEPQYIQLPIASIKRTSEYSTLYFFNSSYFSYYFRKHFITFLIILIAKVIRVLKLNYYNNKKCPTNSVCHPFLDLLPEKCGCAYTPCLCFQCHALCIVSSLVRSVLFSFNHVCTWCAWLSDGAFKMFES